MKRLTLIIIGVLLCTPLYSDMNPYIAGVPVSGGGETYVCVGYDDSCSPSGTPGSTQGATASRTYTRQWVATEGGTVKGVWVYIPGGWTVTNGWFVVYNDTTLIGYANVNDVEMDAWNYADVEAASGQSLTFSAEDTLYFGAAVCPNESTCSIGHKWSGDLYYSTVNVCSEPRASVTWSKASYAPAAVLRYYK